MSQPVEDGAVIAWRLLATLEGISVLLALSLLLVYTARNRIVKNIKRRRIVKSVLITNTKNTLGRELKRRFEIHGCTVTTVTEGAICEEEATSDRILVDALVVVGAEQNGNNLNAMADVVARDVYDNLKLLESLVTIVKRGGCITWACAGATSGAFSGSGAAFDAVLEASLRQVAHSSHCEPLWLGRFESSQMAAEQCVGTLLSCTTHYGDAYSIRNIAYNITGYVDRWLKIFM